MKNINKNINKIMKGGTSKFDFLKTPLLMFFNFLKNVIIKPYNIGIELLIIPRLLFFIICIVIFIISFFINLSSITLYWIYSSMKLLFVILLFMGSIFANIENNNTKTDNFIILIFKVFIYSIKYLYDLIFFLYCLAFIHAYYQQKCGNKTTNTFNLTYFIIFSVYIILILSLLLALIGDKDISYKLFSISLLFLITYYFFDNIELQISNNISYLMNLASNNITSINCIDQDNENTHNNLDTAFHIIFGIILFCLLIIILFLQVSPYPPSIPKMNADIRNTISKKIEDFITNIINYINHS